MQKGYLQRTPRGRVATEGAYRPGPYLLDDGWLSAKAGRLLNFWQAGYTPDTTGGSSAIIAPAMM